MNFAALDDLPIIPPHHPLIAVHMNLPAQAQAAAAHHHHHHHQHGIANANTHHSNSVASSTIEFLQTLSLQSPIDVYDIHEAGWRRAILLAKREKYEFLVRYIGWDSKW